MANAEPARAARSPQRSGGWGGSVCSRRCAPCPSRARVGSEYGKRRAGASRSVAAALRRLGRVGLLTPMRAVPLARACGQRVWQTPSRREPLGRRSAPAAGAGRSAHADARRAPRARVWAASMANAANFRSDFSSASRESASEAEFAKRGVAHVDRLARGARSAPAAAPRSPHHHHPPRPRRAIARAPSSAPIRDS